MVSWFHGFMVSFLERSKDRLVVQEAEPGEAFQRGALERVQDFTPKVLQNKAQGIHGGFPGIPWVKTIYVYQYAESVIEKGLQPFQGRLRRCISTQGSAKNAEPWAMLYNAFGVKTNSQRQKS